MTQPILINLPAMTDQQRAAFTASYGAQEKNEAAGVLFAVFLGGFGAHHFYLRRTGMGVFYLILGFTGISWFLGWIEAFFMPARVRQFNGELAAYVAAGVTGQVVMPGTTALPAPQVFCPSCGTSTTAGVRFCGHCGAAIAS